MTIDKPQLIQEILNILQTNLEALIETSNIARDAATSEESKAENKYDTRGLEASYLAGAQSKRAIQLQESIYRLSILTPKSYKEDQAIASTAIVELRGNDSSHKHFFLLPVAGGLQLQNNIQTLTVEAPLGRELLDKYVGDEFSFKDITYEIINVK